MQVTTRDFTFPLTASNPCTTWTQREGFWLTLADENGREGQGEVCPLPEYSKETLEKCKSQLKKLEVLLQEKSVFELGWQQVEKMGAGLPAALRCGLECAYVQVLSCSRQETIWETLRAILQEMGAILAPVGEVPLAFLLHGESCDEIYTQFSRAWEDGFRTFKIKIGGKGQKKQEQEILDWLSRNMGEEGRLRVDSNGVFSLRQAEDWSRFLWKLGKVEFWEEPGAVPHFPHPPLAQDESLLVSPPASSCSVLVLKPMLLGLFAAMRLIARYRDRNIVISHLYESATGWNLAAALALAVGRTGLAAGLAPHEGLAEKDLLGLAKNRLEPTRKTISNSSL